MSIARCQNGHYYDDTIFDHCPHCKGGAAKDTSTMSLDMPGFDPKMDFGDEKTIVKPDLSDDEKTLGFGVDNMEKTVSIFSSLFNTNPVVGWLVCVSGPERGRDYRLRAGRNFIGRSAKMDVIIADDHSITRENHVSLVYDPKSELFLMVPGESASTAVNGIGLTEAVTLHEGDRITIGDSQFDFVAYCREGRTWLE